jgi:hypothetical protein
MDPVDAALILDVRFRLGNARAEEVAKLIEERDHLRKLVVHIDNTWPLHGSTVEVREQIEATRRALILHGEKTCGMHSSYLSLSLLPKSTLPSG